MIQLVNLSTANIEACLQLTVPSWQRELVPSISECIARSYVDPSTYLPLGLEKDNELIGFVWIHLDKENGIVRILSYLIDEANQKQGFGPEGLLAVLQFIHPLEDYRRVVSTVTVGNLTARNAFEKAGFQRGPVDLEKRVIEYKYATR